MQDPIARGINSLTTLIDNVEEFDPRMRYGGFRMATEILSFLMSVWLANHIGFENQQYADILFPGYDKIDH